MNETESSEHGPVAPGGPVKVGIGGRVFAWLSRAPAFIEGAHTFIERRRRIVFLVGLILVAAVFVFLRVSVKGHAWLIRMVAKLVSARSWILAHPQPLPEVLVVVGILVILTLWLLPKRQAERSQGLTPENRFDRENEARKTLAQIIGGVLVLAGLYSSLQTFSLQQHTFDLQRQGQITDRFTKAIDQLGAVETGPDGKPKINLEVRLGGIYALERIARDSPTDHWTIIKVLSTYVRENSPMRNNAGKTPGGEPSLRTTTPPANAEKQHLRADIQAILTVIVMRDRTYDPPFPQVDLSKTYLKGADLDEAKLKTAQLYETDLSDAELRGAALDGANLNRANLAGALLTFAGLNGAYLYGANLTRTQIQEADLSGAELSKADLNGAYLGGADLREADLREADLRGADLSGAYGVSQSQLNDARGDKNTKLPEGNGLTRPASWH